MKRVKNALGVILAVVLLLGSLGNISINTTDIEVNSNGDESDMDAADMICATDGGLCTLRAAMEQASGINGLAYIYFNIPGEGPVRVIEPISPLPIISQQIIIDGNSQPDDARVQIDGRFAGSTPGLVIKADNCSLLGLTIQNFETGIWLDDTHGTTITGTTVRNSNLDGLLITYGGENRIGADSNGQLNYFAGNGRNGIQIFASNGNRLSGNIIGLLPDSVGAPNGKSGILLTAASQFNIIGGSNIGQENYISSNLENQVQLTDSANNNIVVRNYLQIKPDGSQGQINNHYALEIQGSNHNQIGGLGEVEGNFICGGIKIGPDDVRDINSYENQILRNQIGTLSDGLTSCSPEFGLYLKNSYQNEIIDNLIGGYVNTGIALEGPLVDRNTIQGNSIGLAVDGTALAGVTGVSIYKGNDNLIGGFDASHGNKIAF